MSQPEHPPLQLRLLRKWADEYYPVIAHLTSPFDLVAHPNGPAITDGDSISVIDIHSDDHDFEKIIKMEAQKAWRKYSWEALSTSFYPSPAHRWLPPKEEDASPLAPL